MAGEQIAANIAALNNLKASDPFAYNFYYGDASPNDVVVRGISHGHVSAQSAYGTGQVKDFGPELEAARRASQAQVSEAEQVNQPAAAPPATQAAAEPQGPPPYSGPSAIQKLEGLLPVGFDTTRLPGTFDDPFIEQQYGRARGSAEGLIANMLRRGTITDTGQAAGLRALGQQEPTVRQKLTSIGDLMLENERGSLRGIANQGRAATAGQTGEFFDPSPYGQQVDTELNRFTGAFPSAYGTAAGGINFDTSGLGGAAGAAEGGGRGEPFDPYATARSGTGQEDTGGEPKKKRSTAVF